MILKKQVNQFEMKTNDYQNVFLTLQNKGKDRLRENFEKEIKSVVPAALQFHRGDISLDVLKVFVCQQMLYDASAVVVDDVAMHVLMGYHGDGVDVDVFFAVERQFYSRRKV